MTSDLQQLIRNLHNSLPDEADRPIKESLDAMLSFMGQWNMMADTGLMPPLLLLDLAKIFLIMQGLLESHSGIGDEKAVDAYDMVMDDGNMLAEVGEISRKGHDVPTLFDRLAHDLTPASLQEIMGGPIDER